MQIPSSAKDYIGEVSSPAATFLVETDAGTSMVDFGISPVDTLVMDRSREPKHDDIIMVPWGGHCMVKQPHRCSRQLEIHSGNQVDASILATDDDALEVWCFVT